MTTIGAVVLSYNKAHSISRFWRSLEGQTRRPDKVVIVDDGSTDGTPEALLSICEQTWPSPSVLSTKRLGQSAARNVGLLSLDTDLVIFLDGDITLQVNMLARMELEMKEWPAVAFVYSHYNREGVVQGKVLAKPWHPDTIRLGNYVSPMSLCARKVLPNPCFDESLERYEDWDLWIRMAKAGWIGRLIDETLFTAHYEKGDLSSRGESQDHFFAIRQKHGIV